MYQDDDELDRALFALPLEPLPAGLRASIMAAVTAAPGPVLSRWETVGIGAILALGAWLLLLFTHNDLSLGLAVGPLASDLGRALTMPDTLRWLGFGIAAALCITLVTVPRRIGARNRAATPR